MPTNREALNELLNKSAADVAAMSPAEKTELIRQQAESFVRAEASWPKYKWVDGVKVYDSYEDYVNG